MRIARLVGDSGRRSIIWPGYFLHHGSSSFWFLFWQFWEIWTLKRLASFIIFLSHTCQIIVQVFKRCGPFRHLLIACILLQSSSLHELIKPHQRRVMRHHRGLALNLHHSGKTLGGLGFGLRGKQTVVCVEDNIIFWAVRQWRFIWPWVALSITWQSGWTCVCWPRFSPQLYSCPVHSVGNWILSYLTQPYSTIDRKGMLKVGSHSRLPQPAWRAHDHSLPLKTRVKPVWLSPTHWVSTALEAEGEGTTRQDRICSDFHHWQHTPPQK